MAAAPFLRQFAPKQFVESLEELANLIEAKFGPNCAVIGKAVTLISGLPLGAGELATLAGELKRRCGSGGTVREGTIEIQGEHRDTLVAELQRRGYAAKRSGG